MDEIVAPRLPSFDAKFGKYRYILLGPTSLVPLDPSHNLLVRGSNPCGAPFNRRRFLHLHRVSFSLIADQTHNGAILPRFSYLLLILRLP